MLDFMSLVGFMFYYIFFSFSTTIPPHLQTIKKYSRLFLMWNRWKNFVSPSNVTKRENNKEKSFTREMNERDWRRKILTPISSLFCNKNNKKNDDKEERNIYSTSYDLYNFRSCFIDHNYLSHVHVECVQWIEKKTKKKFYKHPVVY